MSGIFQLVWQGAEMGSIGASTFKRQAKSESFGDGVATLRQRLKQLDVWPDAGDQFLALATNEYGVSSPLTKEDKQWLPQVVAAVFDGNDIGANYPAFFQKLMINITLQQAFLNALDVKFNQV